MPSDRVATQARDCAVLGASGRDRLKGRTKLALSRSAVKRTRRDAELLRRADVCIARSRALLEATRALLERVRAL
jgi:hypothetical protein